MPTPLREAAFAAIAARLSAQLVGVPVERNRRAVVDVSTEILPRLVVHDGDHQSPGSDAAGTTLYRMQVLLEGHERAATDAALGAAVAALHARVVAAICNQEIDLAGEQDIWLTEESFSLIRYAAEESAKPAMGFSMVLGFDLRVPDLGGPYTTT